MGTSTTDYIVTSIKLERRTLEQLKRVAAAEHRTVSHQMRFLIDRCLAEAEATRTEKAAA
jgi:hypothetical protein